MFFNFAANSSPNIKITQNEKCGYQSDEILVVDDIKPGLELSRAASVTIAFAGWDRKDFSDIYKEMKSLCDYTFDSVSDLDEFLF